MHFRVRRIIAGVATLIVIAIVYFVMLFVKNRLGHPAYLTGATLLASLFLLVLLGVRKRLPMLPLGSVSVWTQVHIYSGFFVSAVYVMHVPAIIADGRFELALSLMFLTVTLSGFYGLYASRTLPKKLTAVDGEYRFDQVAWHRDSIAGTAETLLADVASSPAHSVLNQYYFNSLEPYFLSKPSPAYVLVPSGTRRRRLLGGLKELGRYLEEDTRRVAGQFAALVRKRDDLDYHYALQYRLRLWVLIHSVFSVLLIAASIIHASLALRFTL